jgi:Ran GTPase-activating protein (RanGAP) involved in mRNA processing and transport
MSRNFSRRSFIIFTFQGLLGRSNLPLITLTMVFCSFRIPLLAACLPRYPDKSSRKSKACNTAKATQSLTTNTAAVESQWFVSTTTSVRTEEDKTKPSPPSSRHSDSPTEWLPHRLDILLNMDRQKMHLNIPKVGREITRAYIRCLEQNEALEDLWIDGEGLEIDFALTLAYTLRRNKKIRVLRFRNTLIAGFRASCIFDALQENDTLEEFYMESNGIDAYSCKSLARMFKVNKTLRILHINNNPIGSDGACCIAEALACNSSLEELCFQQCSLDCYAADALGRMLLKNKGLKMLQLLHTGLSSNDIVVLCKFMELNRTLEQLVITGSWIQPNAAKALGQLLTRTTTLKKLCLWGNTIKNDGIYAMVDGLRQNKSLTVLRIMKNQISDKGAEALAASLVHHPTLTELDISGNQIKDRGIKACIAMLEENTLIDVCGIHGNDVSEKQKEIIKSYTRQNRGGRRFHRQTNVQGMNWIECLAKISDETDLCYYLIRERPDMVDQLTSSSSWLHERRLPRSFVEVVR